MKYNVDLMPSKSVHWATPNDLYNEYMIKGFIDPCPLNCTTDNLDVDHFGQKLFINPPFDKLDKWVDYALRQVDNKCIVHLLMPARTDTKYFQKMLKYKPSIYFFEGRLKFNDCGKCAPFPTIMVCFNLLGIVPYYQFGSIDKFKFIYLSHYQNV